MIEIYQIQKAERTGQYQFPFVPESSRGLAVRDELVTFNEYCANDENWFAQEYLGKKYRFTLNEMQSFWYCVLIQRKLLKAALMVAEGKFIGINDAKRSVGIFN